MAEQPKALWLAEYLENCRPEDAPVFATATELRRLHEVNLDLIELAEALNDALADMCSTYPDLEVSRKCGERVKIASARLKGQA
jgi:hypothetical protein